MDPVDHLWQRLQDEKAPITLCDVVRKDRNPIFTCTEKLAKTLLEGPEVGPMQTVWRQGCASDVELGEWLFLEVSELGAGVVFQIYCRLETQWASWPFRLATMVDEELGEQRYLSSKSVYDEFMSAPQCCLDTGFAGKLRELWAQEGSNDLSHDAFSARYEHALLRWANDTKITNMHIERLLA